MLITYKYRLYPSKKQEKKLFKQFGICKEIYNTLLEENKKLMTTNKYDFNSLIKDIKITAPNYYSQVHSQVLQNVSDRLNKSFSNFFRRIKGRNNGKKVKVGYPRFKSKIKSITYPQSGFKIINKRKLYVSKIGNIPIILHRKLEREIKTMTIKINASGQWFAYFSCEIEDKKIKHSSKKRIGIDVGLENFATLSNGVTIDNPRYLVKEEKRLKKLQRKLSRKKLRSKNRNKARIRVARQHIKVVSQRTDFLHKLSNNLVNKYSFIAVENLNIKGMVKNHHLAKHINDASWFTFISFLKYKAVISGGKVMGNLKTRGSSKRCNNCGNKIEMSLGKRIFKCTKCNLLINRDLNAALNHLKDTSGQGEISTPVGHRIRPFLEEAMVDEAGTICREDNLTLH